MNAVATLLYNPDYLPGAVVLGYTLRKIVDASTKLVVLIDMARFSHLQIQILRDLWDELVDVTMVESPWQTKLVQDLKRPELAKTFSKVHLWLLPYDKVLYLDSDTLPLVDGPGSVADLLKLDFPKGKIVAAPDSGFPDIFNSGVFVLRPDEQDHQKLVSLATGTDDVSFDGADQGLLNQYFNKNPDWVQTLTGAGLAQVDLAPQFRDSNWIQVPFLYNTTPTAQYQYLPAFRHFGPGNPAAPAAPTSYIGLEPVTDVPGDLEQVPAWETLHNYSGAAAGYFSGPGRAHVKLVHFIGPLKPWKGMDSGLFKRWWDAWYEYSNGRLIADVLYKQYYTISVRRLVVPGQETSEDVSTVSNISFDTASAVASDFTPIVKEYTPADLCDPSNYQQYQTQIDTEPVWDATVEAPPMEKPKETGFSEDLKAYSSQWDEYETEIQEDFNEEEVEESFVQEEVHEEQSEFVELEQPYVELDWYGYHRDQHAERVFSSESDYTPHHYLLDRAERDSVSEPDEDEDVDEDDENEVDANVAKNLAHLDISNVDHDVAFEEDTEPDVAEGPDMEVGPVGTGLPKLFPWEFRKDGYQAEREF